MGDSTGWDKFITRYDLKYPLVTGRNAFRIHQLVVGNIHHAYPGLVVISPTGHVIFTQEGFNKDLIKDINKSIEKNKTTSGIFKND